MTDDIEQLLGPRVPLALPVLRVPRENVTPSFDVRFPTTVHNTFERKPTGSTGKASGTRSQLVSSVAPCPKMQAWLGRQTS
jgi:hypothetical protein